MNFQTLYSPLYSYRRIITPTVTYKLLKQNACSLSFEPYGTLRSHFVLIKRVKGALSNRHRHTQTQTQTRIHRHRQRERVFVLMKRVKGALSNRHRHRHRQTRIHRHRQRERVFVLMKRVKGALSNRHLSLIHI